MRKEKLRKVGLCFITASFIKAFIMINNDFFILQPHSQRNLCFLYQDDVRNIKRGIWERQVATISFIIF